MPSAASDNRWYRGVADPSFLFATSTSTVWPELVGGNYQRERAMNDCKLTKVGRVAEVRCFGVGARKLGLFWVLLGCVKERDA